MPAKSTSCAFYIKIIITIIVFELLIELSISASQYPSLVLLSVTLFLILTAILSDYPFTATQLKLLAFICFVFRLNILSLF